MDGVYVQSDRVFLFWKCLIFPEKYILDGNNGSWADGSRNVLENCEIGRINLKEKIDEQS